MFHKSGDQLKRGKAEFPGYPSRTAWVEFLRPERETELAFVHRTFIRTPQKSLLKLPQALLHSPLTPQGYPKSLPLSGPVGPSPDLALQDSS